MKSLNTLSATELVRLLENRSIRAEQLLMACFERIEVREKRVGAWQHLDREAALAAARQMDRHPRGPLFGLPVGVKDIMDTADMPTTYGSAAYADHRPATDAKCVRDLRAAGGIVPGKTVTTEFAYFQPGKTTNPHNPGHTPGGSSSGSAAAVADCMVPLALGTQTAGSITRPAAFCGVVGYKPTYGTIDIQGVKPYASSLDTVGVFARSVEDAGLLTSVLACRPTLLIQPGGLAPVRVGVCRTFEWEQAADETRAAVEQAATRLSRAGCQVKDMALPPACAGLVDAQMTIMAFEAARSLADEALHHANLLSAGLLAQLERGRAIDTMQYRQALDQVASGRATLTRLFSDFDVLVSPSTIGEAPYGLAATGDPLFARSWTALHVPTVHLPFTTGPNGLPVGIQVIGPFGMDAKLLTHAAWMHALLMR